MFILKKVCMLKKSIKATNLVLVSAHTDSSWDNCTHALVLLTDNLKNTINSWENVSKQLSDSLTFLGIEFLYSKTKFINLEGDNILSKDEEFAYIKESCWEETQENIEQKLIAYRLKIYGDTIKLEATGKNTSEEFFTSNIKISNIKL